MEKERAAVIRHSRTCLVGQKLLGAVGDREHSFPLQTITTWNSKHIRLIANLSPNVMTTPEDYRSTPSLCVMSKVLSMLQKTPSYK